jgi:hypothetical protein
MTTYRVLAELTQLFEIEVEADDMSQALEKAKDADVMDWHIMDETHSTDGFEIIYSSVEEA